MTDLRAERSGDRVRLLWTTPSKTTDGGDISGAMTAEICREAGPRPSTPAARLTACAPVRRMAVVAGASEVWDDLPPALLAEPPVLLSYRIQIYNATGHSAGESGAAAYAAAGAAPPRIESLKASASETGAVLEWHRDRSGGQEALRVDLVVDLRRIAVPAPPLAEKGCAENKSAEKNEPEQKRPAPPAVAKPVRRGARRPPAAHVDQESNEVHLRVEERKADDRADAPQQGLAGTVDATAQMCATYSYVAERVRAVTIDGRKLEIHSEASAPVTLAMRDTFPPAVPTGLATIPGATASGLYIDLSWEPNTEVDLAGYLVYRQLARPGGDPQGPLARLTPSPIAAPAYRDVAVEAGQDYIYSVTAVDAAGNESAPSAKAREIGPAATVQSPQ